MIRKMDHDGALMEEAPSQNPFDTAHLMKALEKVHVSVNHAIFLCANCARIHQENYGAEVSFIKPVLDLQIVDAESLQIESYQSAFEKWSYTQMRVLQIAGGNQAFRDFMN